MPGWLKVLLIVLAVVVVLVIGAIAAGIYYVSSHKDAWLAKGRAVMTEGKDFGRSTDNQGCVDESVSRYKKEPGLTSVLSSSFFMRACLDASRPTPGFCDQVPKQTDFIKSARWRVEECQRINLSSDSNCQQLFTPVQQFCEHASMPSAENSNTNSQ
jgi:hypothetical protein